jgi:hypothetical protein
MNLFVDGGGMIFAALIVGFIFALARWVGDNRTKNKILDELAEMRREIKTKRIYETDRFLDRNRVDLNEIIEAKAAGRLASFNQFVSIESLTRAQIIGQDLDPIQDGETCYLPPKKATETESAFWGGDPYLNAPASVPLAALIEMRDASVVPPPETPPVVKERRKRRSKRLNHKDGARQSITEILSEVHDAKKEK